MKQEYGELEEKIFYQFKNKKLLEQALTHSSYANERKINRIGDYERLEFLGDAVLEVTVSDFLFKNFPDMQEGNMTKTRASLVCEPTLAFCAQEFDLGDFLLLGKGEEMTGGRQRDSIVSDVFEAIIGAIYIDSGIEAAQKFIHHFVLTDWEHKMLFYDSKTILQEKIQEQGLCVTYEVVKEEGPAHDRMFYVEAKIDGKPVSQGRGRSKKAAEQQAAYSQLIAMKRKDAKGK